MKINYIINPILAIIFMVGVFSSCTEDELPNNGKPSIHYVRVTDPDASDSLLVSAYQGSNIAIIGENLKDTRQVWFNDRLASLSPTYITNTSIITRVPSMIPTVITNKLMLVFSNGDTLRYDFNVAISEPEITTMNCEFVNAGEVATIRGRYFYEPVTVKFTGGAMGEIVDLEDNILQVVVPEGAQPGPITITTNFGVAVSDFWFRDNRNILLNADPHVGWWGGDFVVDESDPLAISGNFFRIKRSIGSWDWLDALGGPADALGDFSHRIPDEAILRPSAYNFKFEINTIKPYNNNRIKIMLGKINNPDPNWDTEPYFWNPPFDTEGKWLTMVIPLETLVANYKNWSINPDGYGFRILFSGPGALDADLAFDNFRIVPKILK